MQAIIVPLAGADDKKGEALSYKVLKVDVWYDSNQKGNISLVY